MVTEIDHQAIKNRIVAVFQDNILLWEPNVAGKFRKMLVGAPNGNITSDEPMPYLFITNDDLIEEDEITSTVQNNI